MGELFDRSQMTRAGAKFLPLYDAGTLLRGFGAMLVQVDAMQNGDAERADIWYELDPAGRLLYDHAYHCVVVFPAAVPVYNIVYEAIPAVDFGGTIRDADAPRYSHLELALHAIIVYQLPQPAPPAAAAEPAAAQAAPTITTTQPL